MAYNAQAMVSPAGVDGKASGMLITAAGVTDDTTDQAQLGPMLEKAEETSGVPAETTLEMRAITPGAIWRSATEEANRW